ncbi:MAG: hypothetical protein ACRC2O_10010, partial [Chitinophagaceae bacterium]
MMIKNIFLILTFAFICSNNIQAQSTWNKELGIWVNVELDKRLKLNLPFDSTINIIPRFLWLNNLNELEIESRFEQKRKYSILKIDNETITIENAQFLLKCDTIIMKHKYFNVVRFVKYK